MKTCVPSSLSTTLKKEIALASVATISKVFPGKSVKSPPQGSIHITRGRDVSLVSRSLLEKGVISGDALGFASRRG